MTEVAFLPSQMSQKHVQVLSPQYPILTHYLTNFSVQTRDMPFAMQDVWAYSMEMGDQQDRVVRRRVRWD